MDEPTLFLPLNEALISFPRWSFYRIIAHYKYVAERLLPSFPFLSQEKESLKITCVF